MVKGVGNRLRACVRETEKKGIRTCCVGCYKTEKQRDSERKDDERDNYVTECTMDKRRQQ